MPPTTQATRKPLHLGFHLGGRQVGEEVQRLVEAHRVADGARGDRVADAHGDEVKMEIFFAASQEPREWSEIGWTNKSLKVNILHVKEYSPV